MNAEARPVARCAGPAWLRSLGIGVTDSWAGRNSTDGPAAGLTSAGMANGLRLSEQEQRIQQFHAEIDRRLARTGV